MARLRGTNWDMVSRKEKHGRPLKFRDAGHQWNVSIKPLPPKTSKAQLCAEFQDAVRNTIQSKD